MGEGWSTAEFRGARCSHAACHASRAPLSSAPDLLLHLLPEAYLLVVHHAQQDALQVGLLGLNQRVHAVKGHPPWRGGGGARGGVEGSEAADVKQANGAMGQEVWQGPKRCPRPPSVRLSRPHL